MDLARALPLVLSLGGAGLVAKGGGKVADRVIDTVKIVMTRSELSQVANLLETDNVLGARLPRGDAAFQAWLRENLRARSGRDPALDLWQVPYQLGREGRVLVVRSLGPNMHRDSCATGRDEGRAVERAVHAELAAGAGNGAAATATTGDNAARTDDICLEIQVARRGKAGADPVVGKDSPFRQLRNDD